MKAKSSALLQVLILHIYHQELTDDVLASAFEKDTFQPRSIS